MTLWVDNDMILQVANLEDHERQTVKGATVTATVFEADGVTEVTGEVWPLPLNELAGGLYRGTLQDTVDIVAGKQYVVQFTAIGNGYQARWRETHKATHRPYGS